jgi:hypothetical protein
MAKELLSPALPLFMKTPNGQGEIGDNRDRFVPLPSSTSPFHLQLYEFVGKWMYVVVAARSRSALPLRTLFSCSVG